jgi:hypothetical protein
MKNVLALIEDLFSERIIMVDDICPCCGCKGIVPDKAYRHAADYESESCNIECLYCGSVVCVKFVRRVEIVSIKKNETGKVEFI